MLKTKTEKINISLIAAISKNRVIGKKNKIPWKLINDLKWFKYHTLHKTVIMGNTTYKSIKKPLKNRLNIVLSKNKNNKNKKIIYAKSVKEAIKFSKKKKEIMIIGGEKIYNLFFEKANKIYLTHVETEIRGDTFFPYYKKKKWKTIFIKYHKSDKKNEYNYHFEILKLI